MQKLSRQLLKEFTGNGWIDVPEPVFTLVTLRYLGIAFKLIVFDSSMKLPFPITDREIYLPVGPFASEVYAKAGNDGRFVLEAHCCQM